MANIINIPSINPIKLVKEGLATNDKYQTVHFDTGLYYNQINSYQSKKHYYQKFQTTDSIIIQFSSNFAPFTLRLIDCNKEIIVSGIVEQINTQYFTAPFYGYKGTIDLTGVTEGLYYVQLIASGMSLISEPIAIAEKHQNTMCLEYTNNQNDYGVIFENGETFQFRVEAVFKSFTPGSNDVVYEDEPANLVRLSSSSFRTFKLAIGAAQGVPDWVADRINRIQGCDNVKYDGKEFTRSEGAKLERNGDDFSAMAGWSVDMRERRSLEGASIENEIPQENEVIVVYDIDNSFFGDLANNQSTIIVKTE